LGMAYLYLEIDGKVYTVEREGKLTLPREGDPLPFPYRRLWRLPWGEEGVVFALPQLPSHPHHWLSKDEVPTHPQASPLLREAVYRSLPRVVAEGIIRQGREVLLVKASRGLTKGLWSLPGGFLQFGEAPEQTLKRELEEELGVEARVGPLVAVRAKVGPHSGLHWLFFFYQAHIAGPPRPNPDEISEVRFAPLPEAARLVADETMGGVLEELSRR